MTSFVTLNAQSVLENWEGAYEGEMIVGSSTRANDSVRVEFELSPVVADSVWTYRMTYFSDRFGTVVKDYELRRDGASTVDFLLDEKDGIIIEMTLLNNCFYSMFEVMGNLYSTTLRKENDELLFDLFSTQKEGAMLTKSEADENGDVYEVASYKPGLHQTINFKRKN